MGGFFEASALLDLNRLPELFCYPVACSPQAWSAGAVFPLLQSSMRGFRSTPPGTASCQRIPSCRISWRMSESATSWLARVPWISCFSGPATRWL
jgi:glycogen debranching enzyme